MHNRLRNTLWAYVTHHNPELMFNLQENYSVTTYLEDKVKKVMPLVMKLLQEGKAGPAIEELALEAMTEDLRPSRFLYLKEILKTDFSEAYMRFREDGVLTFETVNLIEHCREVFEAFEFSTANEQDHKLRHAIIAAVHNYLP